MKSTRVRLALAIATATCIALNTAPARAAESCSAYMMDVAAELQLFREAPDPVKAGLNPKDAPRVEPGRLYLVTLPLQKDVRFGATLARNPVDATRPGGLLNLSFEKPGKYRIAIDANFWIDALVDGVPVEALDFRSDRECAGPRKIVTFDLPAGGEVHLQLVDATVSQLRLTVTPVPEEPW
ncbi:MAG TPA: hypothetical protein VNQ32_12805 [Steroidobacteraceae bacterium]|nr:hypothetical protein [Steroidobacteraceae bacterium]